eukprot:3166366-Prymnesium_polylepis.1
MYALSPKPYSHFNILARISEALKFHPKLVAGLKAHAAAKAGQEGEAAGQGDSASAVLDDMFGAD